MGSYSFLASLLATAAATAMAYADVPSRPAPDCANPRSVGEKMSCVGIGTAKAPAARENAARTKRYRFRVAPDEPELEFVVSLDVEPEMQSVVVRRIAIYEPEARTPRETLEVEGDGFVPDGTDLLRLEDLNFDGYGDLAVTVDAGATGNTSSLYWLYDPTQHRFVHDETLGRLSTVKPDPEHKVLRTYWKGGMAGAVYTRGEYRWNGKKLELVREEAQDVDPKSPGGDVFLRVVRALKNGKLKEIEKKRVRYSDGREEILRK